jgi:Domain of unknown function (DUF4407)
MEKRIHKNIFRFLLTCSGEDMLILEKCNQRIRDRFALLGFFVLLIFIGCFFSASFFVYSLFNGAFWISLPVGIIWGFIVVNLYLLLLHTISPPIIPLSTKNKKSKTISFNFFNLSMILRIAFMMLLAIIIAQPLNVFLLSKSVQDDIVKHKVIERVKMFSLTNKGLIKNELQELNEFKNKVLLFSNPSEELDLKSKIAIIESKVINDSLFLKESLSKIKRINHLDEKLFLSIKEQQEKELLINQIETKLNSELISDNEFIYTISSNNSLNINHQTFNVFVSNFNKILIEKNENYQNLNSILDKSNFYVKTIQLLLLKNPLSWILTILVCSIFLIPIYTKYKVRNLCARLFNIERNNSDFIKLREQLIQNTNFTWLSSTILKSNIQDYNTSDYYFHRMLIEHKIILEEYEIMKQKFSSILSERIKEYNIKSLKRILPLLEKLKDNNPQRYKILAKDINKEYSSTPVEKFEYWLDSPFRTIRPTVNVIKNNEKEFLDFIYNLEE